MARLSVNVNKIALVRNTRSIGIPDVIQAARVCLDSGAHGITVHPRPDARHIRNGDVILLSDLIRNEFPQAELNVEGNPFLGSYLDMVLDLCPHQCTLVPDSPTQSTSDHGWNPKEGLKNLSSIISRLQSKKIRVSLFMDPDPEAIASLSEYGVDRVELYTESYASSYKTSQRQEVIQKYKEAAESASCAKLGINAGHDLNLENLSFFLAEIPNILEVSIGHSFTANAIFMGLSQATKSYLECVNLQ